MTKRFILVFTGLLITALFCVYILDIDIGKEAGAVNSNEISLDNSEIELQENAGFELENEQAGNDLQKEVQAPVIDGKWELIWQDTFSRPAINFEHWTRVERRDNYNEELQYYSVHNTYAWDGMLYLTAKKEEKDGKQYVSGMIDTQDKVSFLYGRIEARVKMPTGKGLFPAFWLISENYEIDIMEMIGGEPDIVYGVNHSFKNGRYIKTYGEIKGVDTTQFHVYALEWERDELRWYIDDELFYSTTKNVSNEHMYILFTLAVGGVWPGSPNEETHFPANMVIDEISLYKDVTAEGGSG